MNLSRVLPLRALSLIILLVSCTLYLAPTKYHLADLLVAVVTVALIVIVGLRDLNPLAAIKSLRVLFFFVGYVTVGQYFLFPEAFAEIYSYLSDFLFGFIPFLFCYFVVRLYGHPRDSMLVIALFLVPGVFHIILMYWDILLAFRPSDISVSPPPYSFSIESIKDIPRVGRRYLSVGLLHLLCGGILTACYFRSSIGRYFSMVFVSGAVLSLALLDARAAYASLVVGAMLIAFTVVSGDVQRMVASYLRSRFGLKLALGGICVAAIMLGFQAGESRWARSFDSAQAAWHDVYHSAVELPQRSYVSASYWDVPPDDFEKCYSEKHVRCLDQSMYLRLSWTLEGLESIIKRPFGIGYSKDYFGRLWGVAGEEGKYQRGDSFLVELMVTFGLPGVAIFSLMFWRIIYSLRRANQSGDASPVLFVLGGVILVCLARSLFDVFSEGLWRYLMALMGIYFGLLHSPACASGNRAQCER